MPGTFRQCVTLGAVHELTESCVFSHGRSKSLLKIQPCPIYVPQDVIVTKREAGVYNAVETTQKLAHSYMALNLTYLVELIISNAYLGDLVG